MIHLNATIKFDKVEDAESLNNFQNLWIYYNMLCSMSHMTPIKLEYVDCGDNIEIKTDSDLDFTNWEEFQENVESMFKFTENLI